MQYLLLIYRSEAEFGQMSADDRKKMSMEYGPFTQSIVQSGHFKAGDGLQPTTTATTVRVRDGKTLTTDGPFAETRELVAGFMIWQVKDMDEAVAWAKRNPMLGPSGVEIRPFYEAADLAEYLTPEELSTPRDGERGKLGVA